jgi:hypothetical protein
MAASIKRISQLLDANGNPVTGLIFPGWIDNLVLEADTAKSYTIPTGARNLNIVSDGDIWVAGDATAAIPSGDVIDGSGSLLNPGVVSVVGITTLSLKSLNGCNVSISVYS